MPAAFIPQLLILAILGLALILFIRNRIRYDIIALLIMLAVIASGVLSPEAVFATIGHPAIITVAAMFVMSEAFVRCGIVDVIVDKLRFLYGRPIIGLGFLVVLVMFLSAFVNNAGALAMSIPIAIHLARKSGTPVALFLLPLAFASHLGGFTTLIGTPRNIIISDFRAEATGAPFAMFDFMPVGGSIAIIGAVFLIAISWRLIPRKKSDSNDTPLTRQYTTEVYISEESPLINRSIKDLEIEAKHEIKVMALHLDARPITISPDTNFTSNMSVNLRGTLDALVQYTTRYNLNLSGLRAHERFVTNEDDYVTKEVVIPPYAKIIGSTWNNLPLQKRFGVNFIGLFRRETDLVTPLADTTLWPNDILVLHGRSSSVEETVSSLQLLSIVGAESNLGRKSSALTTLFLLIAAIAIATFNILPLEVIFLTTAILLILLNIISLREAYESIDQTVLILLAGMITLGKALQESGAAASIAQSIVHLDTYIGPILMLLIVLVVTMFLSDFMNTAAAAVVMAPIAILVAETMSLSVDPFLIAVAVGSSCAFLTPIGHESNAMVMKQGGYTFKDYFRVGLPLELIIIVITIPLILHFWPF
jgi:di/tricarboxylate transporter